MLDDIINEHRERKGPKTHSYVTSEHATIYIYYNGRIDDIAYSTLNLVRLAFTQGMQPRSFGRMASIYRRCRYLRILPSPQAPICA